MDSSPKSLIVPIAVQIPSSPYLLSKNYTVVRAFFATKVANPQCFRIWQGWCFRKF
jgi:hypothetical protein